MTLNGKCGELGFVRTEEDLSLTETDESLTESSLCQHSNSCCH
jgi:hypothetical protein